MLTWPEIRDRAAAFEAEHQGHAVWVHRDHQNLLRNGWYCWDCREGENHASWI